MKINMLSQEVLCELDRLEAERHQCLDVINIISEYLQAPGDYSGMLTDEEIERELTDLFKDFDWFRKEQLPLIAAFMAAIYGRIIEAMPVPPKTEADIPTETYFEVISELVKVCTNTMPITRYDSSFMEDEYIRKVLALPEKSKTFGDIHREVWDIDKNHMFYDNDGKEDGFKFKISIGYAGEDLRFPVIADKNDAIFELTPYESNIIRRISSDMKGRVVILGAGFGYEAYALAKKESVTDIVILEADQDMFDLFRSEFLPLIDSDKVTLIKVSDWMDYFNSAETMPDHIFVNKVRNALEYIELLQFEKKGVKVFFSEDQQEIEYIKTIVATVILEKTQFIEMDWSESSKEELTIKAICENLLDIDIQNKTDLALLFKKDVLKGKLKNIRGESK